MGYGSIEALITVPSGGWTVSVNDGGGADIATVPAGTYYPTEFRAAFITALNTATGKTFTISGSFLSFGTGIVSALSINVGTYTLTWTSTEIRDILGFTGNLTPAAATFAGTNGHKGLFLPDCQFYGDDLTPTTDGHLRTDARFSKGPTGTVTSFEGNGYTSHRGVRMTLSKDWAIDGSSSTRISYQQFLREWMGGLSYFPFSSAGIAPTWRIYRDASASLIFGASGSTGVYSAIVSPDLGLKRIDPGWDGLWEATIAELVKQ
jgi:hypothetical protein